MPDETAGQVSVDDAIDAGFAAAMKGSEAAGETTSAASGEKPAGDTDGQAASDQSESTDKAADQTDDTADEHDILSIEERKNLTPEQQKAYKKLMASYTQKTQSLAEQRKQLESERDRYGRYADLIEAFESNPEETLRHLTRQYNIAPEQAQDTNAGQPEPAGLKVYLKNLLGEGNEAFAEKLAEGLEKYVESRIDERTESKLKPLMETQRQLTERAALEKTQTEMKAFETRHPDWKEYEPVIVKLAQEKIHPAPGMATTDYLEILYQLATANKSKAATTTEVVEKLKRAVSAAEPRTQGVKDQIVSPAAPVFKNLDDAMDKAFEAAKRGEVWEQ